MVPCLDLGTFCAQCVQGSAVLGRSRGAHRRVWVTTGCIQQPTRTRGSFFGGSSVFSVSVQGGWMGTGGGEECVFDTSKKSFRAPLCLARQLFDQLVPVRDVWCGACGLGAGGIDLEHCSQHTPDKYCCSSPRHLATGHGPRHPAMHRTRAPGTAGHLVCSIAHSVSQGGVV